MSEQIFEVGARYSVFTLYHVGDGQPEREERPRCIVISVDGPLVKFDQGGHEWILNVHSPLFVEAQRRD